jgi:hypothetical protein
MLLSGELPGLCAPGRVHVPGAGDSTEVTFTLDAQLSGFKRLFMGTAVKKTMDAEAAGLDRAKSTLESRS